MALVCSRHINLLIFIHFSLTCPSQRNHDQSSTNSGLHLRDLDSDASQQSMTEKPVAVTQFSGPHAPHGNKNLDRNY